MKEFLKTSPIEVLSLVALLACLFYAVEWRTQYDNERSGINVPESVAVEKPYSNPNDPNDFPDWEYLRTNPGEYS